MTNSIITGRLKLLRAKMKEYGIDFYIMPTCDFHNSEYSADFFKVREYFCGFDGSNGTLLVSADKAGLWTDGRYFIQAEKQLQGTDVRLFRMLDEGVPTLNEYIDGQIKDGECIGFDGRVVSTEDGRELEELLSDRNVIFKYDRDLAAEIWNDRPGLPCNPAYVVSDKLCGKSFAEKLSDVRLIMKKYHTGAYFLSRLDDIMWLTNLRGNDVECNPVSLSYAFMTMKEFYLFIQPGEVSDSIKEYCSQNEIILMDYANVISFLKNYSCSSNILADRKNVNYIACKALDEIAEKSGYRLIDKQNPTEYMKAVKNDTELENLRRVYIQDSVQLTKFIYWLKTNVGKTPMDEYSVAMKLDTMRSEIPGFIELSFPTISAYGANAAMMHYEATKDDFSQIKPEGMLLVDSGGQYEGGTTDVTRTIVLGNISDEIKKHYTATTIGMLNLANAVFLRGCYGRNLDIMAREPLWKMGIDYKCGTGHGIGYMLNVHEGPQNIRCTTRPGLEDAELAPGMIISDEPGVYRKDSHGIRIENILEVAAGEKNSDGEFLHFNQLTYVPIDSEAIDPKYMTDQEISMLNDYHEKVYETLLPYISEPKIRSWLRDQTKSINQVKSIN